MINYSIQQGGNNNSRLCRMDEKLNQLFSGKKILYKKINNDMYFNIDTKWYTQFITIGQYDYNGIKEYMNTLNKEFIEYFFLYIMMKFIEHYDSVDDIYSDYGF